MFYIIANVHASEVFSACCILRQKSAKLVPVMLNMEGGTETDM